MLDSWISSLITVFQYAIVLGILGACFLVFSSLDEPFKKLFNSKVGFKEKFKKILIIARVIGKLSVIGFVIWLGIGLGFLLLTFIIILIFKAI